MARKMLLFLLTATLAFASAASSTEIGSVGWNESNLKILQAFDEAAVLRFVDSLSDSSPSADSTIPGIEERAAEIEKHTIQKSDLDGEGSSLSDFGWFEFGWHRAGDGKYELAVGSSTGPEIAFLTIYWRETSQKVRTQSFDLPPYNTAPPTAGDNWYKDTEFADLNANGVDELVVFVPVDQSSPLLNRKFVPNGVWPQVFGLRGTDGPFVEASREFPAFYKSDFLPQLENEILKVRNSEGRHPAAQIWDARYLAALIMCRDKVLRVLGLDVAAGLTEAKQWMSSADPVLLDDARIVFEDVGGHQDEVNAANLAVRRALELWPDKSLRAPPL